MCPFITLSSFRSAQHEERQSFPKRWLFSSLFWQDVEIDIELAPGDQTAIPKSKEQAERDAGNQLHMLTNRHDKFLDSLREVKVWLVPLKHAYTLSFSSVWAEESDISNHYEEFSKWP